MKKIIAIILIFSLIQMVKSQNVGINTPAPKENLHISTDSNRVAIRIDHKKTLNFGRKYFTTTAQASSVQNFAYTTNTINWIDLNSSKLVSKDSIRLVSPTLNILPEMASSLKIRFNFSPSIPVSATIEDITLHMIWRRSSAQPGDLIISDIVASNINNGTIYGSFGTQFITYSYDHEVAIPFTPDANPITPAILNAQDVSFELYNMFSLSSSPSTLEIDQAWIEVDFSINATGSEKVNWIVGAKDGTLKIANSAHIDTGTQLSIDERGVTQLKGLKISKNAGSGKVLTSNSSGQASWAEIPKPDVLWIDKNDTALYVNGPIQVNNSVGDAAILIDKGQTKFNNGTNLIETNNRIMNVIIDSDNNQSNEQFNIYKDNNQSTGAQPDVRLSLNQNPSWLSKEGNLGIGEINPSEKLVVNGALKIGNTANTSSEPGTMRWNPLSTDFEGYTGSKWVSLTKNKGEVWGNNDNTENFSVTVPNSMNFENFGAAVSISGDQAIVGSRSKNVGGNSNQGMVYLYKKNGSNWVIDTTFIATDGATNDFYGGSVAITEDYAIVGAYGKGLATANNQGKVYFYRKLNGMWISDGSMLAPDGAPGDFFGQDVSIFGSKAIVGASFKSLNGNNGQGKAYVFSRDITSWVLDGQLVASDANAFNYFGSAVDIGSNYAIVGAPQVTSGKGKVYVFNNGSGVWLEESTIVAQDGVSLDGFGDDLALAGSYLIVGAPSANTDKGKAYIYKRDGTVWNQQSILSAPDGLAGDRFGASVAMTTNYATIGAPQKTINTNVEQGKAYVYKRSNDLWNEESILLASDGSTGHDYGTSVAITVNYILIGAPGFNTSQGKVYFSNK